MRLAIIVPYRYRREDLDVFLPHMVEFLSNKQIDYKIFVAEQSDDRPFNYGRLCNAIVNEIKDDYDYFCFHDIDLLPTNDDAEYYFTEVPVQIFGNKENSESGLPYQEFFGGVTLFPKDVFEKINGFSNDYWGKGYVDLDLLHRCVIKNIPLQKRYDYSNKDLFKSDLKVRSTQRFGSELNLRPTASIRSGQTEKLNGDFTVSFFYYEDFTPTDKNIIFRTLNGFDLQIFTCVNQMIIQMFDGDGKLFQLDVKDIDLQTTNHYTITHDLKKKRLTIFYNGVMMVTDTYDGPFRSENKILSIGDSENTEPINLYDFKLFRKTLNKSQIRKEYYYGIESDWLDLGKPCFFGQESVLLDNTVTLWRVVKTVGLNDRVLIKRPSEVHLPNRKKGQFDVVGFKFEELVNTYDPDIIENKLTYLDLLDGKINTEKFGLNSIKYTKLNNTEFDNNTEWYKIVT